MKFKIVLILSILSVLISDVFAAKTLSEMFAEGTVHGELRAYSYKLNTGTSIDQGDNSIGGLVYLKTGSLNGLSFGVTFATSNNFYSDNNLAGYNLLDGDEKGAQ